jgi:hypothetical protein
MPSKKGRGRHRQHVYRRPVPAGGNRRLWGSHRCQDCGKWCYKTRDVAESAVRMLHPGSTVHYYLCGQWWHYTSMTAEQVENLKDRRFAEGNNEGPEETVP